GECVDEVIWVGDVKQSIYGFRDADPALIFRAVSSVTEGETLGTNWRSAPDLVALQNALFAQPFAERLGLSAEKVVVAPHRQAATKDPAVSVLTLESGVPLKYGGMKRLKNEERAETMGDAVAAFLAEKPEVVDPGSVTADDPEGQVRAVRGGDVAVLVRTNAVGNAIATALRSRGLEVVVTGPGLVATPECQLALAALRVLADPRDSLAAAEVIALEQEVEREQWLTDRLEFRVAEIAEGGEQKEWGGNLSSSLRALRAGREEARSLSPRQQLEMAVRWGGVRETVAKWGPNPARSEQRLSNVEGLLQLIAEYEEGHGGLGIPLSLKGMFAWLEDRVEEGADFRPGRRQVEAIQVRTYHGSKGLEWPVVFCADLDGASRSGLFGMRVVGDEHGERGVRFWVNPFGTERGVDVVDRLRASDIGQAILSREGEEALRLLYVGLSRARDRMVLFRDEPARSGWWDELGVPMDSLGNLGIPVRTGTQTWGSGSGEETGSEGGDVMIPRRRETRRKRLGAEAPPSSAEAVEGAAMGEVLRYGGRLSWKGNPSDRDF
ncbi:MAG: 3'-5' exonuclease, partial [Verrucomicrobiota bacterium]